LIDEIVRRGDLVKVVIPLFAKRALLFLGLSILFLIVDLLFLKKKGALVFGAASAFFSASYFNEEKCYLYMGIFSLGIGVYRNCVLMYSKRKKEAIQQRLATLRSEREESSEVARVRSARQEPDVSKQNDQPGDSRSQFIKKLARKRQEEKITDVQMRARKRIEASAIDNDFFSASEKIENDILGLVEKNPSESNGIEN